MGISMLEGPTTSRAAADESSRILFGAFAGIEPLEERTFFSAAPVLHHAAALQAPVAAAVTQAVNNAVASTGNLVNVSIGKVTKPLKVDSAGNVVGNLVAKITAPGGIVKHVDVRLSLQKGTTMAAKGKAAAAAAATCPILNLTLGPIDLNLLGLRVQTSPICLKIQGVQGSGNLLGNLLCGLTGLLDSPAANLTAITNVLNQLLPINLGLTLNKLVSGANDAINGVGKLALNVGGKTVKQSITAPMFSPAATGAATCPILNLSVGPLHLNLLGLDVNLDNCSNGPVKVDVTAIPGAGNLLGNLLCAVSGLLNGGSSLSQVHGLLGGLFQILGSLGL